MIIDKLTKRISDEIDDIKNMDLLKFKDYFDGAVDAFNKVLEGIGELEDENSR